MTHTNFCSSLFLSQLSSPSKPLDNILPENIYLGIGVCARGALSKAIPFDILSLILCAEAMRRQLNSERAFYIIADKHAVLTGHDPSKVMDYALRLSAILDNIFTSWNIPHTNYLASFINDIDYNHVLWSADNTRYMLAEIEDMYYFAQKYHVGFKLGWKYVARTAEKKVLGFDEWHFDKYARKLKVPLEYRYIKSGHTMNPNCPRVSPYICLDTKNRILLGDHALEDKLIDMEKSNCPVTREYRMYLQEL